MLTTGTCHEAVFPTCLRYPPAVDAVAMFVDLVRQCRPIGLKGSALAVSSNVVLARRCERSVPVLSIH